MSASLLIELLVEEIPPQLNGIADALGDNLATQLRKAGLLDEPVQSRSYQTSRRLTVIIADVSAASPAVTQTRRGPARSRAFDDSGAPTAALQGFLRANQATLDELVDLDHKQAAYVGLTVTCAAQPLLELLGKLVEKTLAEVVAPRMMRWGDGTLRFVRPIRAICAMYGAEPLPIQVAGITATSCTTGHRFLAPEPFGIVDATGYIKALLDRHVVADAAERRRLISNGCRVLAQDNGGDYCEDASLLDEITAMCEWPQCYLGTFNTNYELPREIVTSCMKKHMRCFPVIDGAQHTGSFVFVADNEFSDPTEHVRGIERVMHARLEDAHFCYTQDRKLSNEQLLAPLKQISYLLNLGSVQDHVSRVARLARRYAADLQLAKQPTENVVCAAKLCKAARSTLLAAEYPDHEGLLAADYLTGNNDQVKEMLRCYQDRTLDRTDAYAGDADLRLQLDCLVLAYEFERLAAIAAVHQGFSGAGDPFGLRRSMLRILRVLERHLHINCLNLLNAAVQEVTCDLTAQEAKRQDLVAKMPDKLARLRKQLLDRLFLLAKEWIAGETSPELTRLVSAVIGSLPETGCLDIHDFKQRIVAWHELHRDDNGGYQQLLAANKRLKKIIRRDANAKPADRALASGTDELALFDRLPSSAGNTEQYGVEYYRDMLKTQIELCPHIDNFFDNTLVNDPDAAVRANRHALLGAVLDWFNQSANLEKLYS